MQKAGAGQSTKGRGIALSHKNKKADTQGETPGDGTCDVDMELYVLAYKGVSGNEEHEDHVNDDHGGGEACGHAGEWVYAGYDVWNVEVGKNGVAEKVHVKGLCQHCHGSSHCVG